MLLILQTGAPRPPTPFLRARAPRISAAITPPPAPAVAAGYNVRTFGPNVTLGVNLFTFNFFGAAPGSSALTQNSDGTLTCTGNSGVSYNADCCSARQNNAKTNNWEGQAFGGGAYFESVLKFPAFTGSVGAAYPSFWADAIEGLAGVPSFVQWTGQAAGYEHSCELDFMQFSSGLINKYAFSGEDWYGLSGSIASVTDSLPSPFTTAADLSQYQTYGCLWIPATSTAQGSITWYFNGSSIGSLSYNLLNPTAVPPPVAGTSAMAITDIRHPTIIFGCANPLLPMTIKSCSVWQASTAANLQQ